MGSIGPVLIGKASFVSCTGVISCEGDRTYTLTCCLIRVVPHASPSAARARTQSRRRGRLGRCPARGPGRRSGRRRTPRPARPASRPPARRSSACKSRSRGQNRGRARPGSIRRRAEPSCLTRAPRSAIDRGASAAKFWSSRSSTTGAGPRSSARPWNWSRTRPRICESEWSRSHLLRRRLMISCPERRPVTSGTRWRNSRSTPPSSAWLTAGTIASASPPDLSQPASRSSADSIVWIPLPSAAAALSISTRADEADGGKPAWPRISRIKPTWPIRIVASAMPAFASDLVGQPDHLGVGRRPGGPDQLDPDLGKLAQPARAWVALIAEHRARAAHAPGQGGHSGASA